MKKYTKPSLEVTRFDNEESIMQLSGTNFNIENIKKGTQYNSVDF
jgi:hypothetical protein